MTLWHGRLSGGTADVVMDYSVSLHFDRRLAPDDLVGSRAHVRGLGRGGLLSEDEVAVLLGTLDAVEAELDAGTFAFVPDDEDIHTAVERRVTELAGDVGAKLHTGRSRNDQIATDLRLYAKRELTALTAEVLGLQDVLVTRAREAGDTYLPGYTHLQRAQPVLLAHHLLAHGWALARDVDRLLATVARLDVSPLGAGALAGSSLPLDPDGTAADLGFAGRFENSLDAVSDRDFVAEALFDLALLGVHLSRIGEELVLWSTEEFGFAVLDDAFATGCSMLPQKKNPDVAELARGKCGSPDRQPDRAAGHAEGAAARLQPRPPGGQGAPVRLRRPVTTRPGRAVRPARHGHLRRRADAGGGQRLVGGRRRPGRVAGRAGHAVPAGAQRGRWAGPRLARASRAPVRTGRGPPRTGGRGRWLCSSPGWPSPGGPRRAVPVPTPSPSSWAGSRTGWRPTGSG